jgi:hypothetical protein
MATKRKPAAVKPAEQQDEMLTLKIDGKSYRLDDFTLGELEWLEDELSLSFGDLDSPSPVVRVEAESTISSMKAIVRFVYLVRKRDEPTLTLDDVRSLPMKTFNEVETVPLEEAPAAAA